MYPFVGVEHGGSPCEVTCCLAETFIHWIFDQSLCSLIRKRFKCVKGVLLLVFGRKDDVLQQLESLAYILLQAGELKDHI